MIVVQVELVEDDLVVSFEDVDCGRDVSDCLHFLYF